jgi:hypothetical protein
VRIFRGGNLQNPSFRLAIFLPALPRGCSGDGNHSDGLSGIAVDCAVVADAGIAFGDLSESMLQRAKQYVDNQVCESSGAGRFYPFTGLRG